MSETSDAEQPDLSEVDQVWLGSEEVAGEEFVQALEQVEALQYTMRNIADELAAMDIGLKREDAVNLLWGRTTLNKGQVRDTFRAMDIIIGSDADVMAERLLADQSSELTLEEAAVVWDELVDLAEEYGSLNVQADDGDDDD